MSKKTDTAAALTAILSAKRGGTDAATPAVPVAAAEEPAPPPPSPALPAAPRVNGMASEPSAVKGRGGKSSDPKYSQYSVYLLKAVRKKVGRALDDDDNGQDFSDLVEKLLEQWLASRT